MAGVKLLGMRLRIGLVLLTLLTLFLAVLLISDMEFDGFRLFPPRPDSIHPRPIVELFLEHRGEVIALKGNISLDKPLPRSFRLIIRLSNNSSEPSMRGDLAAGALITLRGAKVEDYRLGGFMGVIGVRENGSIVSPANSSMVEFFARKLDPWQSIEAELYLLREDESGCVQVSYRGWIMDEDDLVLEPISEAEEHYIARYPIEEYPNNPPDSRWAGGEFMKYRVESAIVCP